MLFLVNYKCKSNHIHDSVFEPTVDDLILYFKESKGINLTNDQARYLDFDKIESTGDFKDWVIPYGSKKKQEDYDKFYQENLDLATIEICSDLDIDFETNINEILARNFLPEEAKTTLKRRFNKANKERRAE